MDGRRLGRLSLRADAGYCALAALCLVALAGPASEALAVPVWAVLVAAAGTAAWALSLRQAARGARLRPWLVRVLWANLVGAGLTAALAVTRPLDAVSLLLAAVALEVAAFAVSQALALRRPGWSTESAG